MKPVRKALSLLELLVVLAILGVLVALLIPAVQLVREAGNRVHCLNHLKQLGLALHGYHGAHDCFPPGLICSELNVTNAETTGFTCLLPYLEQDTTHRLYHFDLPWFHTANYTAVGVPVKLFYCPSNRSAGTIDLAPFEAQWSTTLPPFAASTDYAFCRGANGALHRDWTRIPLSVRGVFNVRPPDEPRNGVRLAEITDGSSSTLAMGEAAGANPLYPVRDLADPTQVVLDPSTGRPPLVEQSWSAASMGDATHPFYGSIFAVTAQYGLAADPRDEPMNRRPATPTVWGNDNQGDNQAGRDAISGFRSLHPGGANFLFCDGAARFVAQTVQPAVYRGLSTYAGNEILRGGEW